MATWVSGLNLIAGGLPSASRALIMSSLGAGTAKNISRVLVDTVNDTQRRRRNALQGTYEETGVTP